MAKEKTKQELFTEIKKFVDKYDGIYRLKKPFKIKVDSRHLEIEALIDKFSYVDHGNTITNLVGMVHSWNKIETYDIDDYCDKDKLQELLDNLNEVEEKMRDGYLIFKFEDGVMCTPELFKDETSAEARFQVLATILTHKCKENRCRVEGSYGIFGSEAMATHYRLYRFSVPASAESLYVSCVVDNNSETDTGFSNCKVSGDKDTPWSTFEDTTTVFTENYLDAVDDGEVVSLTCSNSKDNDMYYSGYYITQEDNEGKSFVESHVAMFMEIKLDK